MIVLGGLSAFRSAAATPAPDAFPLVEAVECRPRAGLPNFFAKLKENKEVHIAYFGGSITAQPGWRVKTFAYFQKQYPQAKLVEINAAIGGTGSDLGVYRLGHDVLRHQPDLVFVEFAVNDSGAAPADIARQMEGIVRQIRKANPATDICYVYTLTTPLLKPLQEGKFPAAASAMEKVADTYGIPSIHMGMEVAKLEKEGKLLMAAPLPKTDEDKAKLAGKIVFAGDNVHPYPETGHELYLQAILRSLPAIEAAGTPGAPGPRALPAPLMPDNLEQAKLIPLSAIKPGAGFTKLDPATDKFAKNWTSRLPELWKTDQAGSTLSFRFKGRAVAIYDLLGPNCGQVIVTLDDKPARIAPRFDRYCTYHRLATLHIGKNLPDAVHTVKLELHPDQPNKVKIFKDGKQTDENPDNNPKYQGINWFAGGVLIVGDLE